jgi:hypothetical protein
MPPVGAAVDVVEAARTAGSNEPIPVSLKSLSACNLRASFALATASSRNMRVVVSSNVGGPACVVVLTPRKSNKS